MEIPKITVIMLTYNRKEYLNRSIESVLTQTYRNFDFIIINNGSTDGTDEVVKQYAQEDHRIKLIHVSENRGAAVQRNNGINLAQTEFLTFVDDDDCCEPQMLEVLWNLANEHQADISMCGSWNDFNGRLEPYFIFDELLVLNKIHGLDELLKREKYNVAPPTKLFRKSLFDGIRFKENVRVDDIHVIYKVFTNATTVVAQGVPLYRFTKHGGNMTSFIHNNSLSPAILEEYLSAFRERTEYLSKKVPEIAPRAKYSELSYMISMCDKIIQNCITDCLSLYNRMVETLYRNIDELNRSTFLTEREKNILQRVTINKVK
ncbi:glycosyltransferase family 2 protein [Paenibacillus albiflavus]|uniref:Glycosyltransferase family 2 protein n=1 Tax=Paenibacillus albiflavus TaxID=2545760 RepID=A0A4R4EFL5_9BACL|nr:glycosyltransferase family 2 protein [Paenibacillus albiflavus]TCZ76885.1 glycosyltransferase family 2 protein [Paenibacillus albiflavus]